MQPLHRQYCQNLETPPLKLTTQEQQDLLGEIPGWSINPDANTLYRNFKFKNFYQTMAFTNAVAWIAEQQNHHPELGVSYSQCEVNYSTHSVGGITLFDFICAAHINQLLITE